MMTNDSVNVSENNDPSMYTAIARNLKKKWKNSVVGCLCLLWSVSYGRFIITLSVLR